MYDEKTGKIFITIQARNKLIWTWAYDPQKDYIELRDHEKKVCPNCDPNIRIHPNGGYDYKYVKELHLSDCSQKDNIPKRGLQDKFYYIYYNIEKASKHRPLDKRQRQSKNIHDWTRDRLGCDYYR